MTPFFLQSDRLGFRHWTAEDLPLARSLWADARVARFIHAKGVFSQEEVAARLRREMDTQRRFGIQYWPAFLLASGAFVGCCGLSPTSRVPARWNWASISCRSSGARGSPRRPPAASSPMPSTT